MLDNRGLYKPIKESKVLLAIRLIIDRQMRNRVAQPLECTAEDRLDR